MTKPNNCRHQNIHWEDFFKEEKQNKAYCLGCGADRGRLLAPAIQKWYCEKIKEWLIENGLAEKKFFEGKEHYLFHDFIKFLQKNNYYQHWNDLNRGKIDEDFEGLGDGIGGQIVFWEATKSIEHLCREFAKEKQNSPDKPSSPKNKEKISELKAKIKELETKINKTPEEEAELADKQEQLTKLTKPTNTEQNNNNLWLKPVLIIGGGVIVVGLIIYLIVQNKERK